jgi:hypothetical protein
MGNLNKITTNMSCRNQQCQCQNQQNMSYENQQYQCTNQPKSIHTNIPLQITFAIIANHFCNHCKSLLQSLQITFAVKMYVKCNVLSTYCNRRKSILQSLQITFAIKTGENYVLNLMIIVRYSFGWVISVGFFCM